MKINIKKILFIAGLSLLVLLMLAFGIKGQANRVNYYQSTTNTEVGGPFEASNSTSRYALVESIVNKHSFLFDQQQTSFAAPDVVIYNNKAFSIFTPGVSFVAAPFYFLGKFIGIPQLAAYFSTLIFALINAVLVYSLARKLQATRGASAFSAFVFLFATNALPYAFSLTQHHFSLTVILLALLNATDKRTWMNNILFGIYCGVGLLFDIPNVLLLFPIGLYVLFRHFEMEKVSAKLRLKFKPVLLAIIAGIIPFVLLFSIYNHELTGSYTKIGQTIGRADFKNTSVVKESPKSMYDKKLAFNTRNEVLGLYTLLISNERSFLWYSPVLLVGILGAYIGYKKTHQRTLTLLIISLIVTNVVIYSLFGDPWGGWAFGPRYLIPSAGALSILIALAIDRFKKHLAFNALVLILAFYSIYINVLGMMTTTSIPPKQEAEALVKPIPYTYQYNLDLAATNNTKSYLYTTYLRDRVELPPFIIGYSSIVFLIIALPYLWFWWKGERKLWI